MQKIKTIIIEDEPQDLDLMQNLLMDYPQLQVVATARDVDNAVAVITLHKPDLIFLDINLYGRLSFEILDVINHIKLNPKVIFTTAYDDYMGRAFKYAAFDYLLKPINRQELQQTLQRFFDSFDNTDFNSSYHKLLQTRKKLIFNTVEGFEIVAPDEIVYLETVKGQSYTEIHLTDGSQIIVTKNIGEIASSLPADDFFKLHRSYIINLNFVKKVNRILGRCYLQSQSQEFVIPISREKAKLLKDRLREL